MKPILFMPAMVNAILEGRKIQTRRIIKLQPPDKYKFMGFVIDLQNYNGVASFCPTNSDCEKCVHIKPKYKIDDILYVREEHYRYGYWKKIGFTKGGRQKYSFTPESENDEILFSDNKPAKFLKSRANKDCDTIPHWYKRNSLFMPKKAARIFLKINKVRAERACDIGVADVVSEGVKIHIPLPGDGELNSILQFKNIWDSIHGSETWEDWVFVYEFEKIEKS